MRFLDRSGQSWSDCGTTDQSADVLEKPVRLDRTTIMTI